MISEIISLNILVMYVTKMIHSFLAKLKMLITITGIITIGTGMPGTIFGIEMAMIKKNFSFH